MQQSHHTPDITSASTAEHREHAPDSVRFAVLTISDTRTKQNDTSGSLIKDHLTSLQHSLVDYAIVKDEGDQIGEILRRWIDDPSIEAIVTNGGTGIAGRDVTYGIIAGLIEKPMPGFGELFRMLSWDEVGSASMLSRALAGIAAGTVIFSTPGSSNAARLAVEKLIGPEIGHIVFELRK